MPDAELIYNPHLEGGSFYWEGPDQSGFEFPGNILPGILLIHGFTATTAEVRPLGKILNENGYTISGPLLPGHFTHPDDLNKVRWQDWVDTVEAAYRELKSRCSPVFVGGESAGGLLALYLAAQHPEIKAILAYSPALRLNASNWDFFRLRLLARFVQNVPKPSLDGSDLWQGYPVNPLKGALQLIEFQEVVSSRLVDICQPLLIVQGRNDATVHPDVPEMLASRVSSQVKEIHWMEHSAHTVILEGERDEVARITLDFLKRNS